MTNEIVAWGGSTRLDVLAVTQRGDALAMIERAVREGGDHLQVVSSVNEAIAIAASEPVDVAFVDVEIEQNAGLALVHHLQVVRDGVSVHAMVPTSSAARASEALSLGATGIVILPPTGDSLFRALDDARSRISDAKERAELRAELGRAKRRVELTDRVVRLANGAGHSEAVRAIADALAELSGARGVALYATFAGTREGCVRLAAMGSTRDYPNVCEPNDLARLVEARNARVLSLVAGKGDIGVVVLEQPDAGKERELSGMADLAAAVLAFVDSRQAQAKDALRDDRGRGYKLAYLEDVAKRELETAKRHGRRVSVAVFTVGSPRARAELEEVVLGAVRDSDALAVVDDVSLCLLMPETDAHGAHACRRRINARIDGERRGRASASEKKPSTTNRGYAVGIATFPHDGSAFEKMLRVATGRAKLDARSIVHALGLSSPSLSELADTLMTRAMFDAGLRSPYPLDVSTSTLAMVAAGACREARRGGNTSVHVTLQRGFGLAAAARQVLGGETPNASVHVHDVQHVEGCANIAAIAVIAEHGSWVCCGRVDRDRFRGIHAADPQLTDLLSLTLAAAAGSGAG